MDLDNPDTWPDDLGSLESLANGGDADFAPASAPAAEAAAPSDRAPAADKASAPAAEPAALAAESASAPGASSVAPPAEPSAVLTADGKHAIPYQVLKDTRDQLQAAQARLQELQEAQARQVAQATQPVEPLAGDTGAAAHGAIPADVQARLNAIKEGWGDEIYEQALLTYQGQRRLDAQQATITALQQQLESRRASEARSEQETISDAIAASPEMNAWAQDADQLWMDRAERMHKVLMETDRDYARLSWFDRFKALPNRVRAAFGATAAPPAVAPALGATKAAATKAAATLQAVASAPPTSLTDVPGGLPAARSDVEKLEEMKPAELQAKLVELAAVPGALDKFLQAV